MRQIDGIPQIAYFKPAGVPLKELQEVILTFEELEALRLADLEGLYQEQAAEKMKVSRQTFGRIVSEAHAKVAQALIQGKALRIEGGNYCLPRDKQADGERGRQTKRRGRCRGGRQLQKGE